MVIIEICICAMVKKISKMASEQILGNFVVESDNLDIIKWMHSTEKYRTDNDTIKNTIKSGIIYFMVASLYKFITRWKGLNKC